MPKKKKSLVGYVSEEWKDLFYHDTCPWIEMQLPAIYKEIIEGKSKVRITIEEI